MGAELLHADGRTDMSELIVDFRSFANTPKKKGQNSELAGGYNSWLRSSDVGLSFWLVAAHMKGQE